MARRVSRRRLEARPAEPNPVGPLQVPVRESQPYNCMLRWARVLVWMGAPMGKLPFVWNRQYHSLRPATRLMRLPHSPGGGKANSRCASARWNGSHREAPTPGVWPSGGRRRRRMLRWCKPPAELQGPCHPPLPGSRAGKSRRKIRSQHNTPAARKEPTCKRRAFPTFGPQCRIRTPAVLPIAMDVPPFVARNKPQAGRPTGDLPQFRPRSSPRGSAR